LLFKKFRIFGTAIRPAISDTPVLTLVAVLLDTYEMM